jgi:hypothetical protein
VSAASVFCRSGRRRDPETSDPAPPSLWVLQSSKSLSDLGSKKTNCVISRFFGKAGNVLG